MSIDGDWSVDLEFLRGQARHALQLTCANSEVSGRYRTQFGQRDVSGTLDGDQIQLRASVHYEHVGATYLFSGRVDGDRMEGTVALGEYGSARFTATRR